MKLRLLEITVIGLAVQMSACDTVAELTFQDEQPVEAAVQGLISPQCGGGIDADAVLRFGVLTSFNQLMAPGRRYAALGDALEPGRNFNSEHVTFSDGWFFVAETGGSDMTCAAAGDCPDGASCLSAADMGISGYYPPSKFCVYPTAIKAISVPRYEHFRDDAMPGNAYVKSGNADGRSFGFIVDNSATLDGSQATGVADSSLATDPWEYRKVGLNLFMDGLSMTGDSRAKYEFSAHFANGIGENGVYDATPNWLRTVAQWNANVMSKYPTPSGLSPIWETAYSSLENMTGTANTSYTHSLIAMTDGAPNGASDEAFSSFRKSMQATGRVVLHWLELESGAPHARYAEVTALGCGTHYLFDNPVFYTKIMRDIALNTESHWDVDLKFSANLPEGYIYRLATMMVVSVGDLAVMYEAQRKLEESETLDYRLIFSR